MNWDVFSEGCWAATMLLLAGMAANDGLPAWAVLLSACAAVNVVKATQFWDNPRQ